MVQTDGPKSFRHAFVYKENGEYTDDIFEIYYGKWKRKTKKSLYVRSWSAQTVRRPLASITDVERHQNA